MAGNVVRKTGKAIVIIIRVVFKTGLFLTRFLGVLLKIFLLLFLLLFRLVCAMSGLSGKK